jgi:lipopolysaccharide/colanic/teichoic acid biosynthesis glycosyltransferase
MKCKRNGDHPWPWQYRVIKRIIDIVFSVILSLIFLIPSLIIIVGIRLEDSGPILFWQKRVGKDGNIINIAKFRTMEVRDGSNYTGSHPPVTNIGSFLRKTDLNELPQLYSVLTGDMSLVGPRPVWVKEHQKLKQKIQKWDCRHNIKPGLTGTTQINKIDTKTPERFCELDLKYIEEYSPIYDFYIIMVQFFQIWYNITRFFL